MIRATLRGRNCVVIECRTFWLCPSLYGYINTILRGRKPFVKNNKLGLLVPKTLTVLDDNTMSIVIKGLQFLKLSRMHLKLQN